MSFELQKGDGCFLRVLGRLYRVTVLSVSDEMFWVTFPAMDYALEGMGVDLEFHDSKGYHIYHTRMAVSPERRGDSAVLERSESVQYRHHRRSWRVTTDIEATYSVRPGKEEWRGRILNVGSKGALLKGECSLSEGDIVDLSFSVKEGEMIGVCGQVLRADDDGKYGLSFLDVSPEANSALVRFVWAGLRQSSRDDLRSLFPRGKDKRSK